MTDGIDGVRKSLRQEVYDHARANLFDYTQLMFPEAVGSGAFIECNLSKLLAHTLQQVAVGAVKRQLIAIPPRFGKSLAGSTMLPTWMLGRDPTLKVISASYGDELSRDFAIASRNVMQSQLYRSLFPATKLKSDGTATHRLTTTAGGYRYATSVLGAMTGKGADIIIVDDPLKAKDAITSQAARDEAFNWITGTAMSRFDRPDQARVIVISQRLHTDDLVARLRDEGGWNLLAVPAEALVEMTLDIGEAQPWALQPGDLLFPERFTHEALAQLKKDLGEANYAAQILQDPRALGGGVFKLKYVQQIETKKLDPAKMEAVYQSWDTASSEDGTAAFSVCTTWGIRGRFFGLIDVYRERLTFPALKKAVLAQRSKYNPKGVIVEKASSGIALYQQLVSEGINWIYPVTPRGAKLDRALHQAAKIEDKRLVMPRYAPWAETFLAELGTFPLGRSDQVDSMTQFFHSFDQGRNHVLFRELKFWKETRGEV